MGKTKAGRAAARAHAHVHNEALTSPLAAMLTRVSAGNMMRFPTPFVSLPPPSLSLSLSLFSSLFFRFASLPAHAHPTIGRPAALFGTCFFLLLWLTGGARLCAFACVGAGSDGPCLLHCAAAHPA